jgi:hypothetical protein
METTSYPTTLTSALITVRAIVRDITPERLTAEQIELLDQIASFACANAQEASLLEAKRDLAMAEELEARLVGESDAQDRLVQRMM